MGVVEIFVIAPNDLVYWAESDATYPPVSSRASRYKRIFLGGKVLSPEAKILLSGK